jgi:hypothetical protein
MRSPIAAISAFLSAGVALWAHNHAASETMSATNFDNSFMIFAILSPAQLLLMVVDARWRLEHTPLNKWRQPVPLGEDCYALIGLD